MFSHFTFNIGRKLRNLSSCLLNVSFAYYRFLCKMNSSLHIKKRKCTCTSVFFFFFFQWTAAGRCGGTGANAVLLVVGELKHVIAPAPTQPRPMVADLVWVWMRLFRIATKLSFVQVRWQTKTLNFILIFDAKFKVLVSGPIPSAWYLKLTHAFISEQHYTTLYYTVVNC